MKVMGAVLASSLRKKKKAHKLPVNPPLCGRWLPKEHVSPSPDHSVHVFSLLAALLEMKKGDCQQYNPNILFYTYQQEQGRVFHLFLHLPLEDPPSLGSPLPVARSPR